MEALARQDNRISPLDPEKEIDLGKKMATALMRVVKEAHLSKNFGGPKDHIFFEAWQTLGRFNGSTPKVEWTKEILDDKNNLRGYDARAVVVDVAGMEIGAAEASCYRDEANWKNKPAFQLKSMAQTRAMAKALRSTYAWIAVLAGFSATPAEEMDGVHETKGQKDTPPADIETLRSDINSMLLTMYSQQGAADKLEELTTWVDKKKTPPETVKGFRDVARMKNEKNIQITHGKVKKLYDEWLKAHPEYEQGEQERTTESEE